jgi:transposase
MAKATYEERVRAILNTNGEEAKKICKIHGILPRTFWRWYRTYRKDRLEALSLKKPGPDAGANSIPEKIKQKILGLKQKHPSWCARRIKHQYDLQCHWITVHRIIKSNGMLLRIKPKPQPSKRFQRRNIDSMWQGDTLQFRISGT